MDTINVIDPKIIAARCNEIQTSLGKSIVPEYDSLIIIGMAVRVALHIRGLPLIDYETLKLVCHYFLEIPPYVLERIIRLLADIEFVYIKSEGKSIKDVLPSVPYYDELFVGIGEYQANEAPLNETEQLTIAITNKLASAPDS